MKIYIICILFFINFNAFSQNISGLITGVHDGDSYLLKPDTLTRDSTKRIWIRLLGCDAPEIYSPYSKLEDYGYIVADTMRTQFKNKRALAFTYGKDKYKRTLAILYVGTKDVAYELLVNGWGRYKYSRKLDPEYRKRYKEAAKQAKLNKKGIWKPKN